MPRFSSPYSKGWNKLKGGRLPNPMEFDGHEELWARIAKRLGFSPDMPVLHAAPVIGGRRRHDRPLSSYTLPKRKGTLTLTTDPVEAKMWNRTKGKRAAALPEVKDVFEVQREGEDKLWAIHHAIIKYPPPVEWYLFVDTFFRWRAMAKDALQPASTADIMEFMGWLVDPETEDGKVQHRRRQQIAIPFATSKKRDDKITKVRRQLISDPTLAKKVKWAKDTLALLKRSGVKHRDLDPSNMGVTLRGKVVITNIAESRSQGKGVGRLGRVRGSLYEEDTL